MCETDQTQNQIQRYTGNKEDFSIFYIKQYSHFHIITTNQRYTIFSEFITTTPDVWDRSVTQTNI